MGGIAAHTANFGGERFTNRKKGHETGEACGQRRDQSVPL